jgi:hypothetical protein
MVYLIPLILIVCGKTSGLASLNAGRTHFHRHTITHCHHTNYVTNSTVLLSPYFLSLVTTDLFLFRQTGNLPLRVAAILQKTLISNQPQVHGRSGKT